MLAVGQGNAPNVMVIFGTGQYFQLEDLENTEVQSVYGVHDRGEFNLTRTTLEQRNFTLTTLNDIPQRTISGDAIDRFTQHGWFVDLANGSGNQQEALGERLVFRPFITSRLFVFNTITPQIASCSGSTNGYTMFLDWETGLAPDFAIYNADGSTETNGNRGLDRNDIGYVGFFNDQAGSELGRGGNNLFDTVGNTARKTSVDFGRNKLHGRIGWEERFPFGVIKANNL